MGHTQRVYIIDDSVEMRFELSKFLRAQRDVEISGSSAPYSGITQEILRTKTGVVLFGLSALQSRRNIILNELHSSGLPIIVLSDLDDNLTRDVVALLGAGVVGFIERPKAAGSLARVEEQIVHELEKNQKRIESQHVQHAPLQRTAVTSPSKVVLIGSSTGGPEALASIMPQFPANFPAGIVIVQHMPALFTGKFAQRLNRLCSLEVKEAEAGDMIQKGKVLLAPGDFHLVFDPVVEKGITYAKARLTLDPPQWKLRPTVDNMMLSLTNIYERKIIGVVLTGMGQDGVIGMRDIKEHGGHTLVQNKETSVVYGMAQEVVKNNLADEILPLSEIVPRLIQLIEGL